MIPAFYYTGVFYNMLLLLVIFCFVRTVINSLKPITVYFRNYQGAFILFLVITCCIGFRPIEYGVLGDTFTYAEYYADYERGAEIPAGADWLFHHLMKWCSHFMGIHLFFFLVGLVYVGCIFKTCERLFPTNIYLSFLVCVTAFSFLGYGINGIRNGIATSVMLLAMTYYPGKVKLGIGGVIAVALHGSMILPVFSCMLALLYPRTRFYYWIWLGCVGFSLFAGKYFTDYLVTLNFIDNRLSGYINNTDLDAFSSIGFRWDFLLYSLPPLLIGYYVVIIRGFQDKMYLLLLNTYLLSNAFWVLVIQVAYSNRFAYLSWFIYPVLLIYPFLKLQLWRQQYGKTALCLLLQFGFTYFMWMIGKL